MPTADKAIQFTVVATSGTLEADWQSRIAGSGVVWFHDFRADAEVNAFRWTNGFQGGNDPNALGNGATLTRRITTDGMASGSCLEILVGPGTVGQSSFWWRPYSPMTAPGNGKAVNDPGASGTIPAKTWSPTSGGSQLSNFNQGWYGHANYANADPTHFEGNDFYLQVVCKMDPRRITGGNAANTVGKFIWFSTAEGAQSLSNGEHVIWSYGQGGNQGAQNYVRVYALGVNGHGAFDPLNNGSRIQEGSSSSADWYYSGGWDTLLFHLRPGLQNTTSGANCTLLEIWAAHEGETTYTKIWNQEYGLSAFEARNGLQALLFAGYNNGASFPQQFYHRYAQVIFSKNTIPCPQVYPSASSLPSWASAQVDKTWVQSLSTFTTLASVQPSPIPEGANSPQGLVNSWSSGRAGTYNGHQGYLHFGGGHGDYSGNEVYFIDPIDRRIYRLNNQSVPSGGSATAYGDGKPRAVHTYGQVVWTPGFMWLMAQAGPYPTGDTYGTVWRFNLTTLAWTQIQTSWPGGVGGGVEGASYYSSSRGLIYTINQDGNVWSTNVSTGAMAKISSSIPSGANLGNGSAFNETLGALFYRGASGAISIMNVDAGSPTWTGLTISGTFGVSQYPGMVWHQGSKKIIGWSHTSNRANLFTLAPPVASPTTFAQLLGTWTAASVAPSASNAVTPANPDSTGTFKRLDLIENFAGSGRDWLILFSSISESPNFYKLPLAGI